MQEHRDQDRFPMPGYPFVVIGHPIASDDDAALRVKAEIAVKSIVPFLMNRAG